EHPDDATVLFHLGGTYLALDRPADALPALERSLECADPAHVMVRKLFALLVQCLRRLGQHERAWTLCQTGRSRYPGDPELLSQHAGLCLQKGDRAGAEACYVQLLKTADQPYVVSG